MISGLVDLVRKLMQFSAVATVLLYAYLIYGVFGGQWGPGVPKQAVQHQHELILQAAYYLNLALGVFLVSLSVLNFDEEVLGYGLLAGAVGLFYGVPFALQTFSPGQLEAWDKGGNYAAGTLFAQLHMAALLLAVPGVILTVRDLIARMADGWSRKRDELSKMQYGGSAKEEVKVGGPVLGVMARCWQMNFCREAVRKGCPIFIHRTRCWRERVGCMCEESVVRKSMEDLIHKEPAPVAPEKMAKIEGLELEGLAAPAQAAAQAAAETPKAAAPALSRDRVKIPYNTHLTGWAKRERCRNCVIYNEHQRMKYQFLAPLVALAVPGLAIWQADTAKQWLHDGLAGIDRVMSHLSLQANAHSTTVASTFNSTGEAAQYIVLGCLVVIATTAALRGLEYLVFKLKI